MMLLPSALRCLPFLLMVFLLLGCSRFNSSHPSIIPAPEVIATTTYTKSTIDELLDICADMAKLSASSRTEKCKSLMDSQQTANNDRVQFQLLIGRLLSEDCGDIPERLEEIERLKVSYASDDKLQKLLLLHEQILINMQNQTQKMTALEHKRYKAKPDLETKEALESKDNETRLLREKLEAIRSMEKQLDESSNK